MTIYVYSTCSEKNKNSFSNNRRLVLCNYCDCFFFIPQCQRSTCKATRTSNPPIYHHGGGREGGPETCTHSTGGFCQSGNRSGRSHSHQRCRMQTTRLPLRTLSALRQRWRMMWLQLTHLFFLFCVFFTGTTFLRIK